MEEVQEANVSDKIHFEYSLVRECSRRRLEFSAVNPDDKPQEYLLKLGPFEQHHGYGEMTATNAEGHSYNLWLVPNHLPQYLNYVELLKLMANSSCSIDCRPSQTNPDHLFIETINPMSRV